MALKANELRIGNYVNHKSQIRKIIELNLRYCKTDLINNVNYNSDSISQYLDLQPIPLTEELLLRFGFENWGEGNLYSNQYEKYDRYVLHNFLDGTSNLEVHVLISNYGNQEYKQFIISCDEDDRLNWGEEITKVHQLQNIIFALTNKELEIKM